MTIKIGNRIIGYDVSQSDDRRANAGDPASTSSSAESPGAEIIQMHEKVERPDVLFGSTYKIKSPLFEHALYVTINDILLNADTEYEQRRPFEIFVNSKNMDHFQWIVALTRIMSAVFRKGGDVTFLVEELKAVFDPRGGYFKAGGVYMPSIVAELGAIIETHLKSIGLILDPDMSPEQRALIAEKRAAYEARSTGSRSKKKSSLSGSLGGVLADPAADATSLRAQASAGETDAENSGATGDFPPGATLCGKCHVAAVILMDGCATCLSCGYSKCG
ncbi:MAG TPA: NrdJb [Rhodanobacteraceae bacterium]|nr:NrdJb [Rhodanobacteraceae bacterium]